MKVDPIRNDPAPDLNYPATLVPVTFESGGEKLIGVILQAQGEGPHPTVVLLHGFPGYEKNLDLAHVIRRAGWNVLVFHYRGSWGSQGSYSFGNCLEDVLSALTFLRTKKVYTSYKIDAQNIVLIGHSLGGFCALMTAVFDPHICSAASIAGFNIGYFAQTGVHSLKVKSFFEESLPPLCGTSADQLIAEAVSCAERWNLLNYCRPLSERSLLLVGGSRDETAPIVYHHVPLVRRLQDEGCEALTDVIIDADHLFSDKRVTLSEIVFSWLQDQCKK